MELIKKYIFILKSIIALSVVQGNVVAGTINYTYDALGRLTNVSYEHDKQLNYSYDLSGNILNVNVIYNTNCGDANVFITQKTYSSLASEICTASVQLIAGMDVLVSSGAEVTYLAPQVVLKSGFKAAFGSHFIANTQVTSRIQNYAKSITDKAKKREEPAIKVSFSELNNKKTTIDSILEKISRHPPTINGITLNPKMISGLDFNNDFSLWVFATTQSFILEDQNGLNDIYLYNSKNKRVTLISRTEENLSGDGDSSYPVMDESSNYIAFQSRANNLLAGDNNAGSDIFVYTYDQKVLHIFSVVEDDQGKTEFTHPAIGGIGLTLLYEGLQDAATSNIHVYDIATSQSNLRTSSTSNYFFPAISRDGRYQAYLSITGNGDKTLCSVHWSDNKLEIEADSPCQELNINLEGQLRFSLDGSELEWRDSLWSGSKLSLKNPLYYEVEK